MRTNNRAQMDVIEQLEEAMAIVCDKICKYREEAEEEARRKGLEDRCYEDEVTIGAEIDFKLQKHCDECPLGVISHEFVSGNNT